MAFPLLGLLGVGTAAPALASAAPALSAAGSAAGGLSLSSLLGGSAAPSLASAGAKRLAAGGVANTPIVGAGSTGVPSSSAFDLGQKAGLSAQDLMGSAASGLASYDKRLTNLQFPNRQMGNFAPNTSQGDFGIQQLMAMLSRGGR